MHGSTDTRTVLVLGASGMVGHALMHELSASPELTVRGVVRSLDGLPPYFRAAFEEALITGIDALDRDSIAELLREVRPDVVINAVGVIKQAQSIDDSVLTVEVNGLLPHVLARECTRQGARLIQISTDCVFSGRKGMYVEDDLPDPIDFYGRTKLVGEVDAPHLTLRTSIIGHELRQRASLLEWFLAQSGNVMGYTGAVYSGVTTVELARMVASVVLPRPELSGVWHVAATPITKADLLEIVAGEYDWPGSISPDPSVQIDRSMSAEKLREATGYRPPSWPDMVRDMRSAHRRWTNS